MADGPAPLVSASSVPSSSLHPFIAPTHLYYYYSSHCDTCPSHTIYLIILPPLTYYVTRLLSRYLSPACLPACHCIIGLLVDLLIPLA